jgi:hypothetical protein
MGLFGFDAPVLRLLPYFAYLLTFFLLLMTALKTFQSSKLREIALLILLFVSTTPMVTYYAFEIRGYSFSLLLSTSLFFTLSSYFSDRSLRNFLVLCSLICISISIRYTAISYFVAVVLIVAFLEIYFKNIKRLFLILFLSLCMSAGIFMSQLRYQFANSGDSYLSDHMLLGNSDFVTILKDNFFGFPGTLRLIVISLSFYILFLLRRFSIEVLVSRKEFVFSIVALVITFIQIALSVFEIMPWHSSTRWSIEDLSFTLILIILLNSKTLRDRQFFESYTQKAYAKYFPNLFLSLLLILTILRGSNSAIIQRSSDLQISRVLFYGLNEKSNTKLVFVESNLYPTIRYNFELDSSYQKIAPLWFNSTIKLFSDAQELNNLLLFQSGRPLTIIASNQDWVRQIIENVGLKCASIIDINELDAKAPHWLSHQVC